LTLALDMDSLSVMRKATKIAYFAAI
jgi:hypothetical protein